MPPNTMPSSPENLPTSFPAAHSLRRNSSANNMSSTSSAKPLSLSAEKSSPRLASPTPSKPVNPSAISSRICSSPLSVRTSCCQKDNPVFLRASSRIPYGPQLVRPLDPVVIRSPNRLNPYCPIQKNRPYFVASLLLGVRLIQVNLCNVSCHLAKPRIFSALVIPLSNSGSIAANSKPLRLLAAITAFPNPKSTASSPPNSIAAMSPNVAAPSAKSPVAISSLAASSPSNTTVFSPKLLYASENNTSLR